MSITELHWSAQAGYPVLATLQLLPLAAVALILALRRSEQLIGVGVAAALAELLVAFDLYRHYDPHNSALQFAEKVHLLGFFDYHAAVDGIGILFILLSALLTLMVVLYAGVRKLANTGRLLAMIFAVEAALMGMFATVDLLWFVLFSAVELVLVGYLLGQWATSPDKDLAVTRYLQFMGTGLLLLIVGALMLGWNYADVTGNPWTFNLLKLSEVVVTERYAAVIFFLLFYGLAVRVPLFPLHGWLPLAAEHGTVAIAPVFLLSLKVGVFGLLRFVFPLLPDQVVAWQPYVVAFAVAGIFYAATLALMQANLRRLLAFAVVSHTSILVIGLFTLSALALQGSLMLAVNFGLATAGLLFITGFIFRRTRTMVLGNLGGLFERVPFLGITFFIAGLAIVGMPGTPGFDAVHLVLEASIHNFGAVVTVAAAVGNVVAAGFLLWAFQRAFLGPRPEGAKEVERASFLEMLLAAMMVGILLGTSFLSEPWLDLIETSVNGISGHFESTTTHAVGGMTHE